MGLDMYLSAKRDFWGVDGRDEAKAIQDQLGVNYPVRAVSLEIMYWRKANQIHQWFVTHVQGGADDCNTYWLGKDKLIMLKADCAAVLADHSQASTLIPSAKGFFFGGTEYDSYYFQTIQDTHDVISKILEDKVFDGQWYFEYRSSW